MKLITAFSNFSIAFKIKLHETAKSKYIKFTDLGIKVSKIFGITMLENKLFYENLLIFVRDEFRFCEN